MTAKGKAIVRTTVQHVTKYEAVTDDLQRSIGHYHKCLDEDFGRGENYASNLDGLEGFKNDDVPNLGDWDHGKQQRSDGLEGFKNDDVPSPYENYKESYNGPNAMLDVDDYVKNDDYAESYWVTMTLTPV